ncbi:hypothetical protein KI387_029220, partial [Taxus chinensis]
TLISSSVLNSKLLPALGKTLHQPRYGFRKKVDVMKTEDVEHGIFNIILNHLKVREGLMVFSNWPTFHNFSAGELFEGFDITFEQHQSGESVQVLEERGMLLFLTSLNSINLALRSPVH